MTDKLTFILICHFGLERVLKNEVRKLGLEVIEVTDGELKALGDVKDIPRLNFNLRTAERVMIEAGSFKATTFEELFQNVKKLPIEKYVPVDGNFAITKANQDKNSILHSSMSIQSITKKAMVERLMAAYNTSHLSDDTGKYPFRVKFNKNIASLRLDTTGDSLHKRGYRIKAGLAPIEETLAAALIKLTEYKGTDVLVDPFCGSGTFIIEAAMIAENISVSIDRAFVSETWKNEIVSKDWKKYWEDARTEANDMHKERIEKIKEAGNDKSIRLYGFDIDPVMIKIANENAERAGVSHLVKFEVRAVRDLPNASIPKEGIIICNPPYGERLEDKDTLPAIYKDIKNSFEKLTGFRKFMITAYEDTEKYLGKSLKNRKIYNGMLKSYFYEY